ncbi:nuclease SbcCD, D subunit [gamma proteobacterium NOR5-3]|nr:nuclease SbcCD, D subunit [gamma proteobacterium NOR5-3]
MKLLHTSDWHLGRFLHQHSLLDDQQHVVDQIAAIAKEESVDAVMIAGDLYDRAVPPGEAIGLYDKFLDAICIDLGLPVLAIAGNHDSGERVGFGASLLGQAGYTVSGQLPETFVPVTLNAGGESVDVFLVPYAQPAQVRDCYGVECNTHEEAMKFLLGKIEESRSGDRPTVVMAHCFVAGSSVSDSERELSVGGADNIPADLFVNFDYVALGHLHGPQRCSEEHIRYSGSPLKYSFSEVGHTKSVTIVEIGSSGVSVAQRTLRSLRDVRIVEGLLSEILEQAKTDPGSEDYIQVRLSDSDSQLDVMARLREVYPNVMQVVYTDRSSPLMSSAEDIQEHLHTGHFDRFARFFKEIKGEELNEAQRSHLNLVISEVQEIMDAS